MEQSLKMNKDTNTILEQLLNEERYIIVNGDFGLNLDKEHLNRMIKELTKEEGDYYE